VTGRSGVAAGTDRGWLIEVKIVSIRAGGPRAGPFGAGAPCRGAPIRTNYTRVLQPSLPFVSPLSCFRMRFAPLSVLFVALFVPRAIASVHVVQGVGGGTSNAVQTAVDAAANGDTILVHGGHYGRITLNAKGLTLVAEPEQGTQLDGLTITALPPTQTCVVGGFNISGQGFLQASILISNCSGSVRVVGSYVSSSPQRSDDGVAVDNSSDVAFSRCTIEGGSEYFSVTPTTHPAGRGMFALNSSRVALYDTSLTGGRGQNGHFVAGGLQEILPGIGGAGLLIASGAMVFVGRCMVHGGGGGDGRPVDCSHQPCGLGPGHGGNGGPGANCDGISTLVVFDSLLAGGMKGHGGPAAQCCPQSPWPPGPDGLDGPPSVGGLSTIGGSCPVLTTRSVVREQSTLTLTINGLPGDTISLAFADSTRWISDPSLSGILLFGSPFRRVLIGTIPPSGTLVTSLPVAALPTGVEAQSKYLQIAARTGAGPLRLGSPSWLTILDSSF
jgi:hypothetical protein